MIQTAACLIIGDEVLNGKTTDTNSAFFAKYCFSLGIDLKRVEVIADDESEIIEAATRMSKNYDFVITSGGIGPTHDDITYPSLAKAFDSPLKFHEETWAKMRKWSKPKPDAPPFDWDTDSPQRTARMRMALLPSGPNCDVLYVSEKLWVPIAVVNHNVHVFPGVPSLFKDLLTGLQTLLLPRIEDSRRNIYRAMVATPMPESAVSEYLTDLQNRVNEKGVKVGSYPRWGKAKNTITLVGRDKEYIDSLLDEVEKNVQGMRITVEGENDSDSETEKDPTPNTVA